MARELLNRLANSVARVSIESSDDDQTDIETKVHIISQLPTHNTKRFSARQTIAAKSRADLKFTRHSNNCESAAKILETEVGEKTR